jgi:excisionase family DNA binding protein
MEGTFFSVEEAAKILGCKKTKVYQLLTDGWLNRPPGGARNGRRARVSKKSLFQFMVIDRLSLLPTKTLRDMRNGRKNFGRIFSEIADAKHLSIDEGRGEATEPPAPDSNRAHESSGQPQRCLHHDFAEQQRSMAVLEFGRPASSAFLFGQTPAQSWCAAVSKNRPCIVWASP